MEIYWNWSLWGKSPRFEFLSGAQDCHPARVGYARTWNQAHTERHSAFWSFLIFTNLFGLYLETWVHCWCHGFLGVVMFLWWFHVVLLGICKRILKKHCIVMDKTDLGGWTVLKERRDDLHLWYWQSSLWIATTWNVQLGIWGRSWGNTLPYQFRQNLSNLDLFYI